MLPRRLAGIAIAAIAAPGGLRIMRTSATTTSSNKFLSPLILVLGLLGSVPQAIAQSLDFDESAALAVLATQQLSVCSMERMYRTLAPPPKKKQTKNKKKTHTSIQAPSCVFRADAYIPTGTHVR